MSRVIYSQTSNEPGSGSFDIPGVPLPAVARIVMLSGSAAFGGDLGPVTVETGWTAGTVTGARDSGGAWIPIDATLGTPPQPPGNLDAGQVGSCNIPRRGPTIEERVVHVDWAAGGPVEFTLTITVQ